MKQKQANTESGRSMVEILAVLVLIGLLTIAAIIGIFLAVYKNKANIILHDSKIAFMGMKTASTRISLEWNDIQFQPVSGKKMTVRRDFLRRDFVKVDDVEQGVCRQMLNMRTKNVLNFYNLDNTEMTTCDKTNDIIVDWNGFGPPAVCQTVSDCDVPNEPPFEGICSDQGQCQVCPTYQKPNANRTACVCDPTQAVTCTLNQENWCCGPDLICGDTVGECIESNYTCAYNFYPNGAPGTIFYTDCSYVVSDQNNVSEYGGDCTYVIQKTGDSDKWVDGTGTEQTIYKPASGNRFATAGKGCPANQYCAVLWVDDDGVWKAGETKTAPNNATGIIWGKCQMLSSYDQTPITKYKNGYGLVTVNQGCPADQYCAVLWTLSEWTPETKTPTAPANATGVLYGRCQMLSTYEQVPLSKNESGNTRYRVVKECPVNTYCYLNWKTDTDCSTVPANATGTIYGACAQLNQQGVCPYQE